MKEEETKEKNINDVPLATVVLREYQTLNNSYARTIKRLTIIIIILLVLMTIATTYIVLSWESMNPHTGLIREDISEVC